MSGPGALAQGVRWAWTKAADTQHPGAFGLRVVQDLRGCEDAEEVAEANDACYLGTVPMLFLDVGIFVLMSSESEHGTRCDDKPQERDRGTALDFDR
ncbi:MAG: hypothetical protein ACK4IT_09935 [Thioalkalivibrionaceae bacterium]